MGRGRRAGVLLAIAMMPGAAQAASDVGNDFAGEPPQPAAEWSASSRSSSGDTQTLVLELGRFDVIDNVVPSGELDPRAAAECELDEQRDLVGPFTFRVTNSNVEFDQQVVAHLRGDTSGESVDSAVVVTAVVADSDGTVQCEDILSESSADEATNGGLTAQSEGPIEPGESVTVHGYFIAFDVRSPAHPEGDPTFFTRRYLYFNDALPIDDSILIEESGVWEDGKMPLAQAAPIDLIQQSPSEEAGSQACQTETEQIVCGANEDVQTYWESAYPEAFGEPYTDTQLVLFSGGTNTGCGAASPETGSFYCPADSFVYIDLEFMDQMRFEFGAPGDLATAYIVAHELGHHVQNLTGQHAVVQQTSGETQRLMGIALELQADCYAGAWVRDAMARRSAAGEPLIDDEEIREALDAASATGDDRVQLQTEGRVNPESFTHGTSEQRESWFLHGYETGDPAQCDPFTEL